MEEWQKEHIKKNLAELTSLTLFNGEIQADLRAKDILGKSDLEKLNALITNDGNTKASFQCYEWLIGRRNAYKILTNALLQRKQTGAARILIHGVPPEIYDKPLKYLGISTKLNGFRDVDVEVHGRTFKLHEFFLNAKHESLQKIFQEALPELEIYDTFISKERTFVLANNTIPPKPPYYVSRYLSNRIKLDKSTFKEKCPDVFVFKSTIERYQLTEIARPHSTSSSSSQLDQITSRFIYLDDNEDWFDLKQSATAPIHLINYELKSETFLLEDTSAATDILRKLGSRKDRVYLSEGEFLQQQLSKDTAASRVCICDTPGMGKTFLLANIARLMAENCTGRIVLFIQLNSFSTNFPSHYSKTFPSWEAKLLIFLSYASPSVNHADLFLQLIKAELLQLEIFFDGFDEISPDKVEWMTEAFSSITSQFTNVKIYITSRPHSRQELEKSLQVIAYDILPFSKQNQIDFLVEFWSQDFPNAKKLSLQNHATECLQNLTESLSKSDKEITGIPLLCQLIAEVANYSTKRRNRKLSIKLSDLYATFIKNRISLVAKNEDEFTSIKLAHSYHALKLLFPKNNFHDNVQFKNLNHAMLSSAILKAGIMHREPNAKMEFIHRTFAEFLVTDNFIAKLENESFSNTEETNVDAIAKLSSILEFYNDKHGMSYRFLHSQTAYFLNSLVDPVNPPKYLISLTALFCNSFPPKTFIILLCGCCINDFHNIFNLLKFAMTKCDGHWIQEYFPIENIYRLLSISVEGLPSRMFRSCIHLFEGVLQLDLSQILMSKKGSILLYMAVACANYDNVEYLVDKVCFNDEHILRRCVIHSYNRWDIAKVEDVLKLLLRKDVGLVREDRDILASQNIDLRIIKILVEFDPNLAVRGFVKFRSFNCASNAAKYMSPEDYHELVKFLLTDCKAENVFCDDKYWKSPLPTILANVKLLPETLELLLNIPGLDIFMKDKRGQNLLFSAAKGSNLETLQELLSRGLDYKARGEYSKTLLHEAAAWRDLDIIEYLLSLELDPNSIDQNKWTPLHYAASYNKRLSVVKTFVENGANVDSRTNDGKTALHLNAEKVSPSFEVINFLIKMGVSVNDCDNEGNTPLHLCQDKITDFLVKMGADISSINKKGELPAQTKRPRPPVYKYPVPNEYE